MRFMANNSEITHDSTGFTLGNIDLKGIYSSGAIDIQEFSADLGEGNIKGNFRIDNFLNPTVHLSIISKLRLVDIYPFLKADTIQSMEGDLTIDASFKGKMKQPDK